MRRNRKRVWEVTSFTPKSVGFKKALEAGWEPFAVATGRIWLRRQVWK